MNKKSNWMKFLQILENNGISKLYHFTDRENLESIIKNGGLYSWADCRDKGITIAKPGGSQQSRKLDTRDGLQYYVRLSFTSQHPMLFVAKNEGRISDPVILEIDLEVVYWKGTKYADRNATKTGAKVGETLKDFKRIHFQTIKAKKHFDLPEDEQVFYQAEVLVKNFIPLDFITNIGNLGISIPCQSQTTHIISRLTQSITETVSKFGLIHKEMTYEEQLQDSKWLTKRTLILKRDKHTCQMCGDYGNLNIHHRYYIYGSLAWEYKSNALITLCANCHGLVHRTISPLCYFNNGDSLVPMNFTPCHRCNGAGYLHQYKHVENGICFRCEGKRYEELIGQKIYNTKRYILPMEKCYDVLVPIGKEKQKRINKEGRDYECGINGKPINLIKSFSLYQEAALNGYIQAQVNCGDYLENRGQYSEALRWYVYAAMQGHPGAQLSIANLFKEGLCETQEDNLADEWENKAIDVLDTQSICHTT